MPIHAVVQTAGFGHRLPMRILMKECDCAGRVMRLLLRYTEISLIHVARTLSAMATIR